MKKKVLALALSMALIFCSTANVAFAATDEDSEEGDSDIVVEEIIEEGDDAESEDLETEDPEADEFEDSNLEVDESTPNSGECGDNLTWVLDENGTLTISGTGAMWFENDYAPWNSYEVKKVVIEEGVDNIGSNAFRDCKYLTDVTIPESVTSIDQYAFYRCNSLPEIVIPNGVKVLDWYSLCECSNLKKIIIPDSVETIEDGVFYECSSLGEITLPSGLEWIGNRTFYKCTSLKKIVIPNQVTGIGNYVFYGCSTLEEISIPSSVTSIGVGAFTGTPWAETAVDENGFLVVNNILVEYKSDSESASVPTGITSIAEQAFYNKDSLKKVQMPNDVTSIGDCAFSLCDSLTDVNIPDSLTAIQYGVFKVCTSLTEVEIPENIEEIYDFSFYNTGLTSIIIPDSVTYIGEDALGYKDSEETNENGDYEAIPVEGFTIYGYSGSAAETYANENVFNFVEIKESVTGLSIVPEKTDEVYVRGSGTGAVIYCTGEFSKFVSVEMDGEIVDPSNYTVVEGSTVLTFASSYLDTLSLGRHVVTLNYIDDSISTFLTIVDKESANAGNNSGITSVNSGSGSAGNADAGSNTVRTGDNANIALWLILGIVSVVGCVFASKTRKKSARR